MLASTGEVILSEQYNPFAVLQAWEKTLGPFQLWEMEHRVRYDAFYQRFHDQNSGYFMPSGDEMPEAEAIEIANAALVAAGIKETVLEGLMPVTELYRSEYGHGSGKTDDSWIVSFFHPIPDAGGIYVAECTVMVDAFSGEVRNVVTQPGKG